MPLRVIAAPVLAGYREECSLYYEKLRWPCEEIEMVVLFRREVLQRIDQWEVASPKLFLRHPVCPKSPCLGVDSLRVPVVSDYFHKR